MIRKTKVLSPDEAQKILNQSASDPDNNESPTDSTDLIPSREMQNKAHAKQARNVAETAGEDEDDSMTMIEGGEPSDFEATIVEEGGPRSKSVADESFASADTSGDFDQTMLDDAGAGDQTPKVGRETKHLSPDEIRDMGKQSLEAANTPAAGRVTREIPPHQMQQAVDDNLRDSDVQNVFDRDSSWEEQATIADGGLISDDNEQTMLDGSEMDSAGAGSAAKERQIGSSAPGSMMDGSGGTSDFDETMAEDYGFDSDEDRTEVADDAEIEPEPRPKKLGKFEVVGELGAGGMGKVYKGWHPDLDIPVAIKTIKEKHADSAFFVNRFIREARLATRLSHQNVVRIYDVDRDDDTHFIVQEYVDGDDLYKVLEALPGRRMPVKKALEVVIGITRALVEAEKFKIVHRDIKPSNILITKDGIPKLADLGLAKEYFAGQSDNSNIMLTQSGSSLGSPAYMAPEQVVDAKNVDIRADIYALGVTFYHMITGKLPYKGRTSNELMLNKMQSETPAPTTINKDVPPELSSIIMKMMAKNEDDRYQHPGELLNALERVYRPTLKDNRVFASMAVVAVLVLGLIVAVMNMSTSANDPISLVNREISAGNYDKALVIIQKNTQDGEPNDRLLYAMGICLLNNNQTGQLGELVEQLKSLPDGGEKAGHLQVLMEINNNQIESANQVIEKWLPKAAHKLPYLHSRGVIYRRQGKVDDAIATLDTALQEASFLDFQKLSVYDELARLFAGRGDVARARDLYATGLQGDSGAASNPVYRTNYAIALFKNGERTLASEQLDHALKVRPNDEIATFYKNKISQTSEQSSIARIRETMTMIDDINQNIKDSAADTDLWSSTPLILTFLPLEMTSMISERMGLDDIWNNELITALHEQTNFPVVDRESLEAILRELKLSMSDLSSPEAQLKVGQFMPASILVKVGITHDSAGIAMSMKLIDVQTSEIIAIVQERVDDGGRTALVQKSVTSLTQNLLDHFPLKGKVLAGDGDDFEINLGMYHGLKTGQKVNFYNDNDKPSYRLLKRKPPVCAGYVVDVGKFSAVVELSEPATPVKTNMLVIAGLGNK